MRGTALAESRPAGEGRAAGGGPGIETWTLFLLVFGTQFAFGMWMDGRGFLWGDALDRATSALVALYSTDPHLAAIGFVWMPLPTLLEIALTSTYVLWPQVVSSGFASTFITALAGGVTAVLLLKVSRKFGVSPVVGWAFALLVCTNPMLFLFYTNGMSEGVAAPFLIGATAGITLFWYTGRRSYVAMASLALAFGFASIYQAVPYGGSLFAALVLGVLFGSESKRSAPQGAWRAIEGLGILFLVPSVYVGILWIGANWVIMGDPLYFAHSQYSNQGVVASYEGARLAAGATGDLGATLRYVGERTAPFLIPTAFLLAARILDGRAREVNTISLVLLNLGVPLGLMVPQLYAGSSFGWLRYFMYPLFAAAGWGLYEVAKSRRKRLATVFVLGGWAFAFPVVLWAMANPSLGQDEHYEVRALVSGQDASETGFTNYLADAAPVVRYLEEKVMPEGYVVAADATQGWPIAAQMPPRYLSNLLMLTPDRRFLQAVRAPQKYHVSYLLVPDPKKYPNDLINTTYPRLWEGKEPGFRLAAKFPRTMQGWRLYRLAR